MKKFLGVAVLSVLFAACAETVTNPAAPDVRYTIDVPGNEPVNVLGQPCTYSYNDPLDCMAPLDRALRVLYNRNNVLSMPGTGTSPMDHHGEAEYRVASNANFHLANIWQIEYRTAAEAKSYLSAYITDVQRARGKGYSECAAEEAIATAQWILGAIDNFNPVTFTRPSSIPTCTLSPVRPSATGSVAAGVTLTWSDPWGMQNRYVVEKLTPGGWVLLGQPTAAVFVDGDAKVANTTYVYQVSQCGTPGVGCSIPVAIAITIPPTGTASSGEADCHKHNNGNGHVSHGSGNGNGHYKCDKKNR
jgi:hypothetical protein